MKNEREFLDLATKRLRREIDADDHNRQAAIEDLKFLNGDQWDNGEQQRRRLRGRPCLTTNELPKYVNQVVGDMRHNRARVKVRPVDSKGDINIAKIRSGLIANIEYLSGAEAIYDYAGEMCVSCGFGAWRVLTRYTDENPFLQEIYLERIKNPFLVYMDSSAKSEVYADARYGFVLEKVTRDEFEERFPGKEPPGDPVRVGKGVGQEIWFEKDAFFIADYYVIEHEAKTMCLMEDGTMVPEDEVEEPLARTRGAALSADAGAAPDVDGAGADAAAGADAPAESGAESAAPAVAREREIEVPRVRHYAICADQILDGPNEIPGAYIPIVVVKGPERNIEGKTFVRSLVRDAKDPQRLLNFWVTDASEIVDMIPKAPWIGTARQFEGYEQDYAKANTENFPFLKYNVDPDGAPPPQRVNMGGVPVGVFQQIGQARQAIRDTIGMFASDVGDRGPELSGKAILQRQKPGDVGTFAFIDNLARSVAHSGRIVNGMIPEIYDSERDIRIRNADDSETFVPVNTTAAAAMATVLRNPERYRGMDREKLVRLATRSGPDARYNDLTAGKYDVVITTGPSYATQRQEAAASLERLVAAYPAIMSVAGDLVYKFQDFLGAEEIAERIERTMPPALVPPKEGQPPRPQMPPPPQTLVKMQEMRVKQMQLEVEKEKLHVEKIKALKEAQETSGEVRKMLVGLLQEIFGFGGRRPPGGIGGGV
ncbi:MAG: portal protein [Syntrophorhabdales bacterium]|jgi:hypothetical protein